MNFFEEYYSDKLPPRLTKLREKHKLTQTDVGNASQISQIEKGKRPITNSILYDFKDRTGLSYTDIIFGNLKDFVEDLFYHCFSTILFKDFSMPISNEVYTFKSSEYTQIQKSCLELAKTFANFNIQRKNFNESDELEMDIFHKADDLNIITGDISFNPARSFREKLINEEIVIDFIEMFDILWLMLQDKLVQSFEINICTSLFELDENEFPHKFRLDDIDPLVNKWWSSSVSSEIIPNLIKKLKENPLFNIGFMVNDVLERMYKENIPKSYLTSVPLVISKKARTTFAYSMTGNQQIDKAKFKQISNEYNQLLLQGKDITELNQKYSREELKRNGFSIHKSEDIKLTEERTFDEIINWVTNPYSTRPIQERHSIQLETTKFSLEDKKRIEALASQGISDIDLANLVDLYDINLDNPDVSRHIEGLLTNNSQVTYYFQEQLNEELLSMALALDKVQQAFIRLLDKEEITKFAL
ncbi:helix-turn-helix domain-containing protein [Streptococcus suis]|uniref:helix-turn-helix domain-containing protein n=1 Tax=Streptococcus suis TaxID=1307 RepID=UPI000CF36942|nr:helix-turn-helix transcriptional regulator [Streptococcus suis]MCK4022256.1 helix-turn-helix transcriptional regulator [Streptococcus suis]HEM3548872.1 helix-turn-helix transcriptional regulator [Streptococcus suis]HEM3559827.1 helix-turn-helix transcriptional regulator [Streptococcus suis]HEM4920001.1 helix-turn-helix transcriptional regulator [Streptococcus suis]